MLRMALAAMLLSSLTISASVAPPNVEGCLGVVVGFAWTPAMAGEGDTKELLWRECQVRCSAVVGCARFTYFQDQTCQLHSVYAIHKVPAANAISGMPTCGASSNFWNTDNPLATVTGFPLSTSQFGLAEVVSAPGDVAQPMGAAPIYIMHSEGEGSPPTDTREAEDRTGIPIPDGSTNSWNSGKEAKSSTSHQVFSWWMPIVGLAVVGSCIFAFTAIRRCQTEEEGNEVTDEERLGEQMLKRHRGPTRGAPLDEEVMDYEYPDAQKIKWYPNIYRTPSIVEGLSPAGWKGSVETLVSTAGSSQVGHAIQRPAADELRNAIWRCKVGDTVEVFSKSAGTWLPCTVEDVDQHRMTVVHGSLTRRINMLASDLHENFRLVQH